MSGALQALRAAALDWARARAPLQHWPLTTRGDFYAALLGAPALRAAANPEHAIQRAAQRSGLSPLYTLPPDSAELMRALRNAGLLLRVEQEGAPAASAYKHYDAVGGRQLLALLGNRALRGGAAGPDAPWTLRLSSIAKLPSSGSYRSYDPFVDSFADSWGGGAAAAPAPRGAKVMFYSNAAEGAAPSSTAQRGSYARALADPDWRDAINASVAVPLRAPALYEDDLLLRRAVGGLAAMRGAQ